MTYGRRALAILTLSIATATAALAQSADPPDDASLQFFRDLAETRSYTLGRPVGAKLTPDGRSVVFLRGGPRDPTLRLYELDVSTGVVSEVLTPEAVLKGGEEQLSVEERARRERMRVTLRGFTSFDLTEDGTQLLVSLSGRLYVVRRADKHVLELPSTGWIDPKFSNDGRYVAAVREGEVHVIEVATAAERKLTTGASETLTHGLAEFAAQEDWLKDGQRFLWTTERRGAWQLELRGRDGRLIRELTPVGCECTRVFDVDEEQGMVMTGGGPDPHESHLYRVSLDGGTPVRVSEGAGYHEATFARDTALMPTASN